jgi:CheY-like chemotaxis protein
VLKGLKVLIVENDPDTLELFATVIKMGGATVTAVTSAAEALDALVRESPHVLASDTTLPLEDGYSLMRTIRTMRTEEGGRIPAVAITGAARAEDIDRSLRSGFDEHLSKPVSPDTLIATIARVAGRTPVGA